MRAYSSSIAAAILLAFHLAAGSLAAIAAEPDQVLVLYSADYGIDQDGSEPGQDSKEVAEYYVRRHTDPITGKKPWLLGLSCVHGKDHLNQFRLPEDSQDNRFGVEYIGAGEPPREWPVYDSRQADVFLSKDEAQKVEFPSVVIAAGKKPDRSDAKVLWKDGAAAEGFHVLLGSNDDGSCAYRFCPLEVGSGTVHVWFDAKGKDGAALKNLHLVFHDFDDFTVSTTGRDRIRDDRNYIDDIERPVKDFLENTTADDGTPLRDHILYMVVCHGLPKAVESSYGVMRGTNDNLGDMGDGSSLEQRLMMLYYDITDIDFTFTPGPAGMVPTPFKRAPNPRFSKVPRGQPRDGKGLQRVMIANSLNFSLFGQFNPYQHPMVFRFGSDNKVPNMLDQLRYADPEARLLPPLYGKDAAMHPHLSTDQRAKWPKQCFLYWAMRIDGPTPEIAKGQVDGAVYGTRYFTPKMGTCYNRLAGPDPIQPSVRMGIDELKALGFTLQPTLNKPPRVIERPQIMSSFFGGGPRYLDEGEIAGQDGVLPGGIVYAIRSDNGWKRSDDQFGTYFQKIIESGATVTAGLGAVGGAHITSASWWDDRILFHHLFRGYQLGESLLMSTFYLDWVTAYVGDPLYRPNVLENTPDTTPPALEGPITAELLPAKDSYCAVMRVALQQTPGNPEMAEMKVEYAAQGTQTDATAWCWRFSARPQVVLRNLKPGTTCHYTATFTDAYGNATQVQGSVQVPDAVPSKLRHQETLADGKKATPVSVARHWRKEEPPIIVADAGEIDIEFTPAKEKFRIVELKGLVWTSDRFRIGGGTAITHEPLKFEPGKRYHLCARWRRYPLTREVYLIADDGAEHLVACNNCVQWALDPTDGTTETPGTQDATKTCRADTRESVWGVTAFGDRNGEITIHSVTIFDNANPAPDEHMHPYIAKFQMK